jgi:hypothetical protein
MKSLFNPSEIRYKIANAMGIRIRIGWRQIGESILQAVRMSFGESPESRDPDKGEHGAKRCDMRGDRLNVDDWFLRRSNTPESFPSPCPLERSELDEWGGF